MVNRILNHLDLFGVFSTWRDWVVVCVFIIWVVGLFILATAITVRNKTKKKDASLMAIISLYLIYTYIVVEIVVAVSKYKRIQDNLEAASIYEQRGEYETAYEIYCDLYDEFGDYRDLISRMKRCAEQISVETN